MQNRESLPFLDRPYDTLRQGLPSLKEDVTLSHPVEEMQRKRTKVEREEYLSSLRDIYGAALPASLEIEEQLLDRTRRFPGAVSSNVGLEARMGTLDRLSSDDFAELPVRSEIAPPSLHELMEKKHGISKQPTARAMF